MRDKIAEKVRGYEQDSMDYENRMSGSLRVADQIIEEIVNEIKGMENPHPEYYIVENDLNQPRTIRKEYVKEHRVWEQARQATIKLLEGEE